ncbi:MAG TPA: hypothetical protein VHA37_06290, partial [Candidatus Saccharimonadales bacterium]|nr:hypothetical protein [Candidatus Saccharimonadales bacterium]
MNDSTPPDLDVLMERIRAELKNGMAEPDRQLHGAATAVVAATALGAEPPTRRYRLGEFVRLDNESFVRNAYLAVLGREPSELDRLATLHRLESGQTGRASLLRELLASDEGRLYGSKIANLQLRAAVERLRY